MKLSMIIATLIFATSSFALEFCSTSVRVNIPSSPWVNTMALEQTLDIYKTIKEKGFISEENAEFFLSFQHGSYEKKKIAMNGAAVRIDTYIITRLTVKNAEGKILFTNDKDQRFTDDNDMSMKKILLMKRHIKSLPTCSKLTKI